MAFVFNGQEARENLDKGWSCDGASNDEIEICFENQSEKSITVAWVNFEGGLSTYATLHPGKTHE